MWRRDWGLGGEKGEDGHEKSWEIWSGTYHWGRHFCQGEICTEHRNRGECSHEGVGQGDSPQT